VKAPPLPEAKVGQHCIDTSGRGKGTCKFALPRLVNYWSDLNDRKVAITVRIRAIRRILARDPVIRTGRRSILEYHEVVISLAARGINTFLIVEREQRIRVTPVQWQCGIPALSVGDIWIRTVRASRLAHIAIVETEISGWREHDAGTGRSRDLILGDRGPTEQQMLGSGNRAG
jgi:hypothetical protein